MKSTFHILRMSALAMLLLIFPSMPVWAGSIDFMSDADNKSMDAAIHFMDNGMVDESIELLSNLNTKYPERSVILYEIVYAHIIKKDFDGAYAWAQKMMKAQDLTADAFFMGGNAYDYAGHRKEAIKLYETGLKKFPESGRLWVEKGNMAYLVEDYDEAVRCYEEAVERDPAYDASYYRLARLFGMTYDPVWAIMYAQTYMLISNNEDRIDEMSLLIYNIYHDNIKRENGEVKVTLTQNVNTSRYASADCDIPFNYVFEMLHLDAAAMKSDTLSVADVAALHRSYVERADTSVHDYYDVPILDIERQALHAGCLDGYIAWMLAPADIAMGGTTFTDDESLEAINAFINWFNNDSRVSLTRRGVARDNTTVTHRMPIPRKQELEDAAGCAQHRDEILTVSRWLLNSPVDTISSIHSKVSQALVFFAMNTSEFTMTIDDNPLILNTQTMLYYLAASIDYYLSNKEKKTDVDAYVSIMMRTADFIRSHRQSFDLNDEILRILEMNDDQLATYLKQKHQSNDAQSRKS